MSRLNKQFACVFVLLGATTFSAIAEPTERPRAEGPAGESAKAPAAPATNPAETTVTLSGKFVLPKELPHNVDAKGLDLSKLTGELQRMLPGPNVGKPEGFDKLPKEEQRAWLRRFVNSPEYPQYAPALMKYAIQQSAVKPLPLTFNKDGSFEIKGLQPGEWVITARIPDDAHQDAPRATFEDRLILTAEKKEVDLGERTLTLKPDVATR